MPAGYCCLYFEWTRRLIIKLWQLMDCSLSLVKKRRTKAAFWCWENNMNSETVTGLPKCKTSFVGSGIEISSCLCTILTKFFSLSLRFFMPPILEILHASHEICQIFHFVLSYAFPAIFLCKSYLSALFISHLHLLWLYTENKSSLPWLNSFF